MTRSGNGGNRQMNSCLTGSGSQRGHTPFQRGQTFLKHGCGGIHNAGVNIAKFFQIEQPGSMVTVLKYVGRSLVNGYCPRAGGRIRFLTGMQLQGFEPVFFTVCH